PRSRDRAQSTASWTSVPSKRPQPERSIPTWIRRGSGEKRAGIGYDPCDGGFEGPLHHGAGGILMPSASIGRGHLMNVDGTLGPQADLHLAVRKLLEEETDPHSPD